MSKIALLDLERAVDITIASSLAQHKIETVPITYDDDFKSENFDLVIADISHLNTKLHDFMQEKRRRSPSVPVVVLAMPEQSYAIPKAMNCGVVDYLTNPFKNSDLLDLISKHISGVIITEQPQNEPLSDVNDASLNKCLALKDYMHKMEFEYIDGVISKVKGNRSKAAKILGIGRASLYRNLKEDC